MKLKISVIGAGSSVFSLSLIRDICCTANLNGCTVSFMDIDEKRLDNAYALCVRYAAEMGSNIAIEKTTDRLKSLENADFVINTALHVNYDMWKRGWKIAQEKGYRYGGSLHIMHDEAFWINYYQFGLMESIYLDILKICPNAWYLVVANPVLAGITYLKRKYPDGKIVGLCHGFNGVYAVAGEMGFDREDVRFELSGVNHMVWLTHFTCKGEDGFRLLNEWIEKESEKHFGEIGYCSWTGPKPVDLYKRYGVFPIGDTANPGGGAWGWWYHTDEEIQKKWKEDPERWFQEVYFEGNERVIEEIARAVEDESVRVSELFPPEYPPSEPMVPLIESIACDIPRIIITNILNDGEYVQGVPKDFEVEIPTLVSGNGIQGIRCKKLPPAIISHILRDRVAPVLVELDAYEKGDYELLVDMIMMDPWTRSEQQARELLDAILEQPELAEMKEHYKKR
ncbi:MAG TPA: hypothetical protein H9956_06825 [Candidatus Eisenbergiella pullicola]|nr:hypothetical protein [Candidatus Eisenbergiella pullicola]